MADWSKVKKKSRDAAVVVTKDPNPSLAPSSLSVFTLTSISFLMLVLSSVSVDDENNLVSDWNRWNCFGEGDTGVARYEAENDDGDDDNDDNDDDDNDRGCNGEI